MQKCGRMLIVKQCCIVGVPSEESEKEAEINENDKLVNDMLKMCTDV